MQTTVKPFGYKVPIGENTYHTILVKFFFTNPKHIPQGIPDQRDRSMAPKGYTPLPNRGFIRPSDQSMDLRHTKDAYEKGFGHLANEGRIREGRVDTGTNFIKNVQNIHAAVLMRGLANVGYGLCQCHWFVQPEKPSGASAKYVVVLGFEWDKEAVGLPNSVIEQRRVLAATCWQWCHGWANPDGTITLNFGGRLPEARAKNAVIVRDWALMAAEVTEQIKEENE